MEKAHFIENRVFKDKRGAFSPFFNTFMFR